MQCCKVEFGTVYSTAVEFGTVYSTAVEFGTVYSTAVEIQNYRIINKRLLTRNKNYQLFCYFLNRPFLPKFTFEQMNFFEKQCTAKSRLSGRN